MAFFRSVPWWQWLGFGGGVLAMVAAFLPWTSLHATDPEVVAALAELPAGDVVRSAWNSAFFAWFPPILLLLIGVLVLAIGRLRAVRVSGFAQVWLLVAALAVVMMVVGWFLIGWQFDGEQREFLTASGVSIDAAYARYLGLLGGVASLAGSIFDLRAGRTPDAGR